MSQIRRYSIRQLCPFTGVLQVVEMEDARAMSTDGVNWELQVAAERPDSLWGSINQGSSERQFFRFGVWSDKEGLARVPVNPIMDVGGMLALANKLLVELETCHEQLPFPLADTVEYWLLDGRSRLPLALLAASCSTANLEAPAQRAWTATRLQEQHFPTSAAIGDAPSTGYRLENCVKRRAGSQRLTQWFRRKDNGDGVGLGGRIPDEMVARRLPAGDFPELMLDEHWEQPETEQLARDFLRWSAPLLLTLNHISYETRDRLEQQAAGRALLTAAQWRLYPEIINRDLLERTRVEARLRKAAAPA